MVQTIAFLAVLLFPFIVYLINMALAQRDQRGRGGIAAGIPKPKEPKAARSPRGRTRTARVRSTRVEYCGRGFAHFALALVGSQDSCKYCSYVQNEPTPIRPEGPGSDDEGPRNMPPPPEVDDDRQAAIREAEEILERWKQ